MSNMSCLAASDHLPINVTHKSLIKLDTDPIPPVLLSLFLLEGVAVPGVVTVPEIETGLDWDCN